MAFEWTKEQQQVIELTDRNLLVSAAAGSGKTAVLVERIIHKICDGETPIDVDKLLVVTFTNAAAAEMKERVRQAIEKRLEKQPENAHLKRQSILLNHASITTIHSFCLMLLRNEFHRIELDPGFRIGDEGELSLLQNDVLESLLEKHYEEADEAFLSFVETYAPGRDDASAGALILQLYRFAMSAPFPEEWLSSCADSYRVLTFEQLEEMRWMKELLESIRLQLTEFAETYDRMIGICQSEDGPALYTALFEKEKHMLDTARGFTDYADATEKLAAIKFATRPRAKKTDEFSPVKQEMVIGLRDGVKKEIKEIGKAFFSQDKEMILHQMQTAHHAVRVLVELTTEFIGEYQEAKQKRNLIDFSDMEHLARRILVRKDGGEILPTETALQYAEQFEEIMIDEYQDSNAVQELILNSISKERQGKPNVFMVGDVKQSIYQFRLARPELFMEKYDTYTTDDSQYQKIELHQNFRSRAQVLKDINFFFYQMMKKQVGNITYSEETALHPGMVYPEANEEAKQHVGGATEVMLLELSDNEIETEDGDEVDEQLSDREWEARMLAARIKELTDPVNGQMVLDKQSGTYRRAMYRDIVILLRTVSGWAEPFIEVLEGQGIPASADSQSGYFTALEVQTILNLLTIIDNPMQDIPLAAVLHSMIGGFDNEELARVKISCPKELDSGLYGALINYAEQFDGDALAEKVKGFLDRLERYRRMAEYLPLHTLITDLLDDTGYGLYVRAMPGGERRKANLNMLVEKAVTFEATSYRGVFQFVRYIEKLKSYSVDYGEATVLGEQDDVVRVMSIHKSKGLEFPIVILAGTAKRFNQQDSRAKVIFHPDYGIGADAIDPVLRTKNTILMKKALQRKLVLDSLGEELRVLYVALTRAKEKLIITGAKRGMLDYLEKKLKVLDVTDETLSYQTLITAGSYLDWLVPALAKHRDSANLFELFHMEVPFTGALYRAEGHFAVGVAFPATYRKMQVESRAERMLEEQALAAFDPDVVYDADMAKQIHVRFAASGNHSYLEQIHATMSVSDIKRLHLQEEGSGLVYEAVSYEEEEHIPRFVQGEVAVKGALRGTVYHRLLEILSPVIHAPGSWYITELERLKEEGILTAEELAAVNPEDLYHFFESPIGKRMTNARSRGKLHLEEQFIIGVPAQDINPLYQEETEAEDAFVTVQGIIDAWFEEEDGIVLLDYKTDRVAGTQAEEILRKRYRVQLDYYERAITQTQRQRVKERYIYSFALGREILV